MSDLIDRAALRAKLNGQLAGRNHIRDFDNAIAVAIRFVDDAAPATPPTDDLGALRDAAKEVWASIPASYDYDDPMVQRHAKALNALGAIVETYAPFASAARLSAAEKEPDHATD